MNNKLTDFITFKMKREISGQIEPQSTYLQTSMFISFCFPVDTSLSNSKLHFIKFDTSNTEALSNSFL